MQSSLRTTDKPIAWVGADRILLDDTTCYGLRRWVIAQKDGCPDMVNWVLQAFAKAGEAEVSWWLVWKDDGYCYLWIVWKDGGS